MNGNNVKPAQLNRTFVRQHYAINYKCIVQLVIVPNPEMYKVSVTSGAHSVELVNRRLWVRIPTNKKRKVGAYAETRSRH